MNAVLVLDTTPEATITAPKSLMMMNAVMETLVVWRLLELQVLD